MQSKSRKISVRKRKASKSLKRSGVKRRKQHHVENFYCMKCREKSPTMAKKYETKTNGNRTTRLARADCEKCGTRMCVIVAKS